MQELGWLWDKWDSQHADLTPMQAAELQVVARIAADPAAQHAVEARLQPLRRRIADLIAPFRAVRLQVAVRVAAELAAPPAAVWPVVEISSEADHLPHDLSMINEMFLERETHMVIRDEAE